jgi:hypothetical protein
MANKYHSDVQSDLAAVDFGAVAEADFNAQVDLALNTAIPASNVADSVNDMLLDQVKPRLPVSGTLAIKPTINSFLYASSLQDTGDLEAATKTIAATSEGAAADYTSASKTMLNPITPADARFVIRRIATRASITIDSDDGTHDLRCRIYVDTQDTDHLLYDLTFTTIGNQLAVQDCAVGTKEIIFNIISTSTAHVYKFFFWSPGNHSPVISVVNAWSAVGSTSTVGYDSSGRVLSINSGPCLANVYFCIRLVGTGASTLKVHPYDIAATMYDPVANTASGGDYASLTPNLQIVPLAMGVHTKAPVTTIVYPHQGMINFITELYQ